MTIIVFLYYYPNEVLYLHLALCLGFFYLTFKVKPYHSNTTYRYALLKDGVYILIDILLLVVYNNDFKESQLRVVDIILVILGSILIIPQVITMIWEIYQGAREVCIRVKRKDRSFQIQSIQITRRKMHFYRFRQATHE
jgi:hypothetical protein